MNRILVSALIALPVAASQVSAEQASHTVRLETNHGNMTLELYHDKAPKTVENFLGYVKDGFYNGTIFHRVIEDFMIQGGGFSKDMEEKETKEPITNEADNGLKNEKGTIAMARTSIPHSATAQFFINTVDNPYLNHTKKSSRGWGYCVFAKVVEGMDTVASIASVSTARKGGNGDVPVTPVIIERAVLVEKNKGTKAQGKS